MPSYVVFTLLFQLLCAHSHLLSPVPSYPFQIEVHLQQWGKRYLSFHRGSNFRAQKYITVDRGQQLKHQRLWMVQQTVSQSFHHEKTQFSSVIHGNADMIQLSQHCKNYLTSNCPRKDCQKETFYSSFIHYDFLGMKPARCNNCYKWIWLQ